MRENNTPVGSGRFRDRSQDSPLGSWEHLVRRPFRSGRSLVSAPLPPEIISPHSRVKQTPLSPGYHSLCPRVAQRDAPFKENGSRSYIVAGMVSATPAELFPRHQEASDVTRIICEAAPHSTACLMSARCATRGDIPRDAQRALTHQESGLKASLLTLLLPEGRAI